MLWQNHDIILNIKKLLFPAVIRWLSVLLRNLDVQSCDVIVLDLFM